MRKNLINKHKTDTAGCAENWTSKEGPAVEIAGRWRAYPCMTFSAGQCCTNSASMPSSRPRPASSWGAKGSKLRGCRFTEGAWMGGALHRAWKLSADSTGEGGEGGTDPSAGVGSLSTCSHQARLHPVPQQLLYSSHRFDCSWYTEDKMAGVSSDHRVLSKEHGLCARRSKQLYKQTQ